jgi:2,4-dienoyl-CoA reductase [(3E)-enoyl-CoA-producing], peroxisomal
MKLMMVLVDGAAWRTAASSPGAFSYPDFLLSDEVVTKVKGGKDSKL